jgi:hypothetical protein
MKQLSELALLSKETNMPVGCLLNQKDDLPHVELHTGGLSLGALCPTGRSPYSMYSYGMTHHEHFKCDHTVFS